jgi:hypothetical protein
MARPKANTQVAPAEETKQDREPFVADLTNLTPEELAIAKRVAKEDDSWQTITEGDMNDFSLQEDPYPLPPPAKKAEDEKRFEFRWIERKASRIDEMTGDQQPKHKRWWICNRTSTPFLAKYVDPIHGGVARYDQLLVFRPWSLHMLDRRIKDGIADSLEQRGVSEKAKEQGFEGGSRFSESSGKLNAEIRGTGVTVSEGEDFLEGRGQVLTDDLIDETPD